MATFHKAILGGTGIAKRRKAMFRNFKVILLVFAILVIAGSTYAFAAAITGIPDSKAGEGVGEITGYAVSNVVYTFDGSDPSKINSVAFTTDALATVVKIKLVTAGSTWYVCDDGVSLGLDWTCDTTVGSQATVATTTGLTIVASNQAP
jgi:hypothetical protein